MLSLCTLTLAGVLAIPADSTPDAHLTLPVAGTDVQIRFDMPGWKPDDARLQLLRKSGGEYVLAAGYLGNDDVRVTIHGGPGRGKDGEHARKGALGERLLGMGLTDVAGYPSAQTIRQLNPPYREFDRHVFLVGADAMAHVQIIALEATDPEKFGDARFESVARGARFAVVRRTAWEDLTSRYLELSHAAALRADGLAWLREQAEAPAATWMEKIVAAEHAHAAKSKEAWVLALDTAVRDELAPRAERSRAEDAGLLLAQDGIGMAHLRAGDAAAAEAPLAAALAIAEKLGGRATSGVRASLACLHAARNDADGVVKDLEEAYAVDPALRYRMQSEPLIEPVTKDPRVVELLVVKLQMRPNRQLGH